MASKSSLTLKFGIVSAVLLLLSVGLCGMGAGNFPNSATSGNVLGAGLIALGLGVLGLGITVIMAIVQAVSGRSSYGVHPTIAPPPPTSAPPPSKPDDESR